MKSQFSEFYTPSEDEFAELWKKAIFVVDTSFLLDLYRRSEKTSQYLLELLKKVAKENRLWIPHQVALEFYENRIKVISLQIHKYASAPKEIGKIKKIFESEKDPHLDSKHRRELERLLNEIQKALRTRQESLEKLFSEDHILDSVTSIFEKRVGKSCSEQKLKEIYSKGEDRFSRKIPPGYEDQEKDGVKRYGDLIVWLQIMEKAESDRKPIIFVTEEKKEDWWLKNKGKIIGPRPELIREMKTETAMSFYMYQTKEFMQLAGKMLEIEIPVETVQEVSEVVSDMVIFGDSFRAEVLDTEGNVIQERQCLCTNLNHSNHEDTRCRESATEGDDYCKECHDKAASEFSQTQ